MTVFEDKKALSSYLERLNSKKTSIGLVPTMGALHDGHGTLVQYGLRDNEIVVVSIFVNPTQFNNSHDLTNYPRNLKRDTNFLKTISNEKIIVYAPSIADIYGNKTESERFDFDGLENEMEGRFRPGHFDGVGTIIKRLFQIIKPNRAYFGEKDYQQLMIVKKLESKYRLGVEIKGCPIFRAEDGLAMSSRNERLTLSQRKAAPFIYQTLRTAKKKFGTESATRVREWVVGQFKENDILELEYFIIANSKTLKAIERKSTKNKYRAFIAVFAGDVRLIDNIALN
ncbi:MAG: pantoate--beta-alanine ligase [Bacteroidota bacterium]